MPVINQALVRAGYTNVSSVVTTFDSGGDTGRLRTDERGRVLAFSDYWRSLISLWKDGDQKKVWEDMLRYRDGRGRNFGNIFFQFMSEKTGNLSLVDSLFCELTGAVLQGHVVPVSLEPSNVCFATKSGKSYCGEHFLDDLRMSEDKVVKIWLEPEVKANDEAIRVIEAGEVIVVCPGSMYGSVITNFLPQGVTKAYKKSKAKKVLMTNIMSVANENNSFTQNSYVATMERYLGSKPFDMVLMPDFGKIDSRLLTRALASYRCEHSFQISPEYPEVCSTVVEDIAIIDEANLRFRHSIDKLSKYFASW